MATQRVSVQGNQPYAKRCDPQGAFTLVSCFWEFYPIVPSRHVEEQNYSSSLNPVHVDFFSVRFYFYGYSQMQSEHHKNLMHTKFCYLIQWSLAGMWILALQTLIFLLRLISSESDMAVFAKFFSAFYHWSPALPFFSFLLISRVFIFHMHSQIEFHVLVFSSY